MPTELFTICSQVNDIGKMRDCDLVPGWHINSAGQLDSGHGIMQGLKQQLKAHMTIDNPMETSSVVVSYKLIGFKQDEQLRIGINGQTLLLTSENTEDF